MVCWIGCSCILQNQHIGNHKCCVIGGQNQNPHSLGSLKPILNSALLKEEENGDNILLEEVDEALSSMLLIEEDTKFDVNNVEDLL